MSAVSMVFAVEFEVQSLQKRKPLNNKKQKGKEKRG